MIILFTFLASLRHQFAQPMEFCWMEVSHSSPGFGNKLGEEHPIKHALQLTSVSPHQRQVVLQLGPSYRQFIVFVFHARN